MAGELIPFMEREDYPYLDRLRPDAADRLIGLKDIRVLVFTTDRTQRPGVLKGRKIPQGVNYVHQMLSSLFMADPRSHELAGVDLMLGTPHREYLDHSYRHTNNITIHDCPKDLTKGFTVPQHKLTCNFLRTLRFALEQKEEGFLICEDDVVFRDGFWGYALDAINEMRAWDIRKEHNAMTFYSRRKYFRSKGLRRGVYFCSGGGPFAGLCGIYYDKGCIQSLIDYIEKRRKDGTEIAADLMYRGWGDQEYTRYATPLGLVQHVGAISSGTSVGRYWSDPSFDIDMKCWYPVLEPKPYKHFFMRKDR